MYLKSIELPDDVVNLTSLLEVLAARFKICVSPKSSEYSSTLLSIIDSISKFEMIFASDTGLNKSIST